MLVAALVVTLPASVTTESGPTDPVGANVAPVEPAESSSANLDPIEYQNDGEEGIDAEDECEIGNPPSITLNVEQEKWGMLVPVDDRADLYRVPVTSAPATINLVLSSEAFTNLEPLPNFDLRLRAPNCIILATSETLGQNDEAISHTVGTTGDYVAEVFFGPPFSQLPSFEPSSRPYREEGRDGSAAFSDYYCHPPCGEAGYLLHRLNDN